MSQIQRDFSVLKGGEIIIMVGMDGNRQIAKFMALEENEIVYSSLSQKRAPRLTVEDIRYFIIGD